MQRGADCTVHVVVEAYIVRIGGVKHQAHIVFEMELQIATSSADSRGRSSHVSLRYINVFSLMYHSRADEIFAARQWFNTLCAAYVPSHRLTVADSPKVPRGSLREVLEG
jgi:hypothetical protein